MKCYLPPPSPWRIPKRSSADRYATKGEIVAYLEEVIDKQSRLLQKLREYYGGDYITATEELETLLSSSPVKSFEE